MMEYYAEVYVKGIRSLSFIYIVIFQVDSGSSYMLNPQKE